MINLHIYKTMISLSEYVDVNENQTLLWHFKEEFDLDYNNGYKFLIEKHGTYDGLMEFVVAIAVQLADDIKDNDEVKYELSKDQLIDEEGKEFFQNIFFDKIIIDSSKSNSNTAYLPNKSHYDKINKSLDLVYIKIDIKEENTYDKLVRALSHELTHAYENYKRQLNGKNSLLSLVSNNTKYYKAIHYNNDGSFDDCIKSMEYYLTSFEKNAFLTEFRASLEGKKIRDYKDALENFKKTEIWQQYNGLHNLVNSDIDWQDFCDTYNEEFDTDYSVSKFKKWIITRIEKTYRKMLKLIPKVYFDYYDEQKKKDISESIISKLYNGLTRLNNYKMIKNGKFF